MALELTTDPAKAGIYHLPVGSRVETLAMFTIEADGSRKFDEESDSGDLQWWCEERQDWFEVDTGLENGRNTHFVTFWEDAE